MPQPIFSFKNVTHEIKGQKVLVIKKFEMHRGATYVVDGSMGSGKTSLINILARNIKVKLGECEYEQKNYLHTLHEHLMIKLQLYPNTLRHPMVLLLNF